MRVFRKANRAREADYKYRFHTSDDDIVLCKLRRLGVHACITNRQLIACLPQLDVGEGARLHFSECYCLLASMRAINAGNVLVFLSAKKCMHKAS